MLGPVRPPPPVLDLRPLTPQNRPLSPVQLPPRPQLPEIQQFPPVLEIQEGVVRAPHRGLRGIRGRGRRYDPIARPYPVGKNTYINILLKTIN